MSDRDILTIANEFGLEMELAGPSFVGCCPFHEETAPSFTVFPSSQHFKCYGCRMEGDAAELESQLFAQGRPHYPMKKP